MSHNFIWSVSLLQFTTDLRCSWR